MQVKMNYYKKCNLIAGWGAFAISAIVYLLTMEPTASLWDCAEFISTSYKLEVGHPPGAPLFMMIARFFTIFAPSVEKVAVMVNTMSSLCSAFTILFMFWTITHLGRKICRKERDRLTKGETWTIMGAGLVGSLAYTFSDTFWFSAIEGEVYAMSSMFTALVVWAMLQWENAADKPHSTRWLVLIAYLMGLSIGIHILNLLTIPALVFIYYFKKSEKVTTKGLIYATLASGVILLVINSVIIPYTVAAGAVVDRWFVNGFGLPINSGITVFVFALFALCAWGIWETHRRGKVLANTIILCATVIFLGYSSYASVTIRAAANPPMNSNDPSNPYALLSLLNRDQYEDRPLLYGHWYSAPAVDYIETPVWYVDDNGKYAKGNMIRGVKYPSEFKTLFPRMYDYKKAGEYEKLVDIQGRKIPFGNELITVPTFGENMEYFIGYQMNFMYWRYFLWNFVGRQSDNQGTGSLTEGNWLSGIKFIDELYLGPQDNLPSEMANNKGRNKYYFLPFILGLIGLIYQLNRDKRNFAVVMWLFLMMGVVLVLYFNSTPGEPRERDYVYAGSFYAFCIWIGFGVMWLRDVLLKITQKDTLHIAVGATLLCSAVPVLMAVQNWDDHDRSHRYIVRDLGWNYLNSCLPNSIIMNYGDNDTFPLWYAQEVEGVRLDVKIMNTSYLGAEWYVDQMRIKSNDADPVPFSLPRNKYVNRNDVMNVYPIVDKPFDIKEVMEFIKSEHKDTKLALQDGSFEDFMPAKQLILPVNKENAIASGIVRPEDYHLMEDSIIITLEKNRLLRNELMIIDLLATFDWTRPLYFTQIYDLSNFGLQDYLQFDGYTHRLVPIKTPVKSFLELGRVDTEYLYNNLMNVFRYGNIEDPRVYADTFLQTNYNAPNARNGFAALAKALLQEGDTVRAVQVLDEGLARIPFSQIRYTFKSTYPHIEAYYLAGEFEKGNDVLRGYAENTMEYIRYFMQFTGKKADMVYNEMYLNFQYLDELYRIATVFRQDEVADWIDEFYTAMGID